MRGFLLLLFATICGYGALQIGKLDPDNYVKMYVGNYVVEINLLGFLLFVLAFVIVLYALLRLIRMIWKAPKSYSTWMQRHQTQTADADLGSGYLSLIKGDWKRAEKRLTQHPLQTHQQMGDWQAAQHLLPKARKQKALPDESLDALSDQFYSGALSTAKDKQAAWNSLPRDQKKKVDNVFVYARFLSDNGESTAAEKLIRTTLKSEWSDDLVRLYGQLQTGSPAKQRRHAEGWLLARPENAELNLAAGRLAFDEKKFDIAKTYLQASINSGQLPKAYSLLGEVYEAANESSKALQLYRTGMLAVANKTEARRINVPAVPVEELNSPAPAASIDTTQETAKEGELVNLNKATS